MNRTVEVTRTPKGYTLSPTFGFYAGKIVAYAEQVYLVNVEFIGKRIVGEVLASWGTEIREQKLDLVTVKALGVGGVFRKGPPSYPTSFKENRYLDHTGRPIFRSTFVSVNQAGVFAAA